MGWRLPGWSAGGQFRAGAASVGVPPRFVSSPFFDNIVELTTPERLDSTTCFGAMQKVMIVQVSSATVAALGRNPKLRIYLRCGKFDGAGALVSSFPRMIRWYLDGQHITEAAQTRFCPIDITGHMQVGGRVGARTYRLEVYQANRMDPVPNSTLRKYAAQVPPPRRRWPPPPIPVPNPKLAYFRQPPPAVAPRLQAPQRFSHGRAVTAAAHAGGRR